jgi:NAD(P)-dependent dehydrogenase (short-subunit alcohol dehydrogenase family)
MEIQNRLELDRRQVLGAFAAASLASVAMPAHAHPQGGAIPSSKPLAGKVSLVTGARANLGRAFAVALAEQGSDIVVHFHREATRNEAEETARLVRAVGARAVLVAGDLGNPQTATSMFDTAKAEFGRADILVNNAGAIVKKPVASLTDEDIERMISANTRSTYYCCRLGAQRLENDGRVINIGTSLLAGGAPNYAAYAGTKACMEELTRMMSRELGARGITVNTVAPGPIDTPFFHSMETPETTAFASNLSTARRLGTIQDIVPLVTFLASPQAQWVNGQTLWINGGYLTR